MYMIFVQQDNTVWQWECMNHNHAQPYGFISSTYIMLNERSLKTHIHIIHCLQNIQKLMCEINLWCYKLG